MGITLGCRHTPMKREFNVLIELDGDGYSVASVPELRGCHTQARSLDSLHERITEAIALCLEKEHSVLANRSNGFAKEPRFFPVPPRSMETDASQHQWLLVVRLTCRGWRNEARVPQRRNG